MMQRYLLFFILFFHLNVIEQKISQQQCQFIALLIRPKDHKQAIQYQQSIEYYQQCQ